MAVSPHLKALQAAAAQSGTNSKKLRGKSPCQLCLDHFDQVPCTFSLKGICSQFWPSESLIVTLLGQKLSNKTTKNRSTLFFQFYGKTFGSEWPSLRLALLSRPKFAALVNKYAASNVEQTKTRLMKMGCYSVTQQYKDNLQEFLKGMNIVLDASTYQCILFIFLV